MTSETVIVAKCSKHFAGKGYAVTAEVPIGRKVADLYCVHRQSGECVAVEAKLRDWPAAVTQALVYQLGADRVFIAMPADVVGRVRLEELATHGIGLLSVSEKKVRLVLDAEQSAVRRPMFVQRAVSVLGAKASVASLWA